MAADGRLPDRSPAGPDQAVPEHAGSERGGPERAWPERAWPEQAGPGQTRRERAARPVPNFPFPETCAGVIARAAQRREWLSRPLGQKRELDRIDREAARAVVAPKLSDLGQGGALWLTPDEGERLLATHGLPITPSWRCASLEQATAAAAAIDGPVALKAAFAPPAHAADVDAVLLGLRGDTAVHAGWEELRRRARSAGRAWSGVVVQPLVDPGADILLGTVRDASLGPLMALGLGGRQASLLSTASFRLLPVTDVDAAELINTAGPVRAQLEGFRGQPPLDHDALLGVILRFAELIRTVPEVLEADLNPVRLLPRGASVLDLRIRIGRLAPVQRVKTW
jgi:hypothetical protein